jgi:hypothetical protein
LGHFDEQGFISLVRGLARQAEAFGRAPSMILGSGHGTLRLRSNARVATFVPATENNLGDDQQMRSVRLVRHYSESVS